MRTRLLLLVVGALASAMAAPAVAHEGAGTLAVEQAEAAADGQVRYVVRLTWNNDGHAALDATVNATLIGADGTPQTPVPLPAADQDGRYAATVTFPAPGNWTVRFTAVKPQATLEQAATIAAPATTSTLAPTTATTAAPDVEPAPDSGSSSGGGSFLPAIVVGAVLGGAAAWFFRRRRGTPAGTA